MPTLPDSHVLKKRRDFLKVAAFDRKWVTQGFVLQAAPGSSKGLGFTASKRVGHAVLRNRAKRRLRALAREVLVPHAKTGHHYVLIARASVLTCPYQDLRRDMLWALKRLSLLDGED
ncbi:MAG: ribonuclease P protein component [Alphaproteobacteria bacterium]|nr:ribonuclease P protein component [Alphaproteobacteria bacterium]